MKNWMILPLALVISLVTTFVTADLFAPTAAAPPPAAAGDSDPRLADLLAAVERLEASQAELARALREAPASAPSRVAVGGVEEAVERWLDEHAERVLAGHSELASLAPQAEPDGLPELGGATIEEASIESILAYISSRGGDAFEDDIWQKLRDAGRIGEVVAAFEQMAEEDPTNPDLQLAVGTAYLQELFGVGASPRAGELAVAADRAFDRALEIDPNHWEARFTKAVSLSNWPAFLGKTGEAIRQFELLVEQQKSSPPDPKYAQSYLFLGNMYLQTGDSERALQAWRDGLALYPDADYLREQIESNGR